MLYCCPKIGVHYTVQGVHEFFTTVLADDRVGVNTLFPSQRVEIADNANQQLRLTHTQDTSNAALGIWTDFQTTNLGDLYIHPSDSLKDRNVGINISTPQSDLHIHRADTSDVYAQFTNGFSGSNITDGFRVGINTMRDALLQHRENRDMIMITNDTIRMNIRTRTIDNRTRTGVAIPRSLGQSFVTIPRSILHLGDGYFDYQGWGGWRPWMDIGTFTQQEQTDFAFFGITNSLGDTTQDDGRNDAVIVWGDNIRDFSSELGPDNLRFIFSAPYQQSNTATAGSYGGA